jgi:hypothetical protein
MTGRSQFSLLFPYRLAFFEKGPNALFRVIGGAQAGEGLVHVCELLRIVHVFGGVEGTLGDLDGQRAFLG